MSLSCVTVLVSGISKTQPKLYILATMMLVLRSDRFYFSARSKDEKCVFVSMKLCVEKCKKSNADATFLFPRIQIRVRVCIVVCVDVCMNLSINRRPLWHLSFLGY